VELLQYSKLSSGVFFFQYLCLVAGTVSVKAQNNANMKAGGVCSVADSRNDSRVFVSRGCHLCENGRKIHNPEYRLAERCHSLLRTGTVEVI
jgi:hypothetical protein